jgi:PAS domain S-box-containing protein
LAVLIAVTSPLALNVLFLLRPSPLDPTPIAFTISGAALAWAIFRYRFLDMIPAARHAIIENMSDALVVLDQSLRIVDLNPAARPLVTASAPSPIGQPLVELLPESARSLSAVIAETDQREAEVTLDGRDYELRISPVRNKDGAVTGRVLLLHDITEQKQTREALRQSVETSQLILESIEDGFYEIDLRGNITNTTDVTARMGGMPNKEAAIGHNFAEFTDPADTPRLISVFNRIYRTVHRSRWNPKIDRILGDAGPQCHRQADRLSGHPA